VYQRRLATKLLPLPSLPLWVWALQASLSPSVAVIIRVHVTTRPDPTAADRSTPVRPACNGRRGQQSTHPDLVRS
jgi:hypothetical protein